MQDDKNFISEIISRRIPQLIGMYIATVWLAVEISDWMSNKFNVLPQLSSGVFIGMFTFLPAVMVMAWGHGRPGKDRWSAIEKFIIPLNILVSVFAIVLLVKTSDEIPNHIFTNETILDSMQKQAEVINDKNQTIQETSIQPNYNRVLLMFWDNKTKDKANDWLSYAGSWLVAQDLKRTPDISSVTPYSSFNMMQKIQNKGFLNAKSIPFSLALQLAQKSSKNWMVTGSFSKVKNLFSFEVKLYEVETGKLAITHTESDINMFVALDNVSTKLSRYVIESKKSKDNIIPDLAIEDHVSSNVEAIQLLINAYNLVSFEKDYESAILSLNKALDLDKNFVLAHILAVRYYQKLGDYPNAIKHIDKALTMDYKIYQEQLFELKAGKFYMQGDRDKAGLVQEKWVSIFPNSPSAHGSLAGYYLYSNNKLDQAKEELEILLRIDKSNPQNLIDLGKIYRIQENKAKATEILGRYLEESPEDADAYLQMGYALSQFGLYKKAIKLYEQASVLGTEDFDAETAKAKATMKLGQFDEALNQLNDLLLESRTDQEKYWVLHGLLEIYITLGQNKKALDILERMKKPGKNVLDPFNYMFAFEDYKITILNEQGKYNQAIKYSQSLRDHSKPPFDSVVGIFFLITYGNMGDIKNYKVEFENFEKFLDSFNNPYWKSFAPALKSRILVWGGKKREAILLIDNSVKIIKQSISGIGSFDKINEIEYFKAIILTQLNKYKEAIEVLENIVLRDPIFAKAYALLAKIYKDLNQNEQFEIYYSKAITIWKNADEDLVELIKLKALKN